MLKPNSVVLKPRRAASVRERPLGARQGGAARYPRDALRDQMHGASAPAFVLKLTLDPRGGRQRIPPRPRCASATLRRCISLRRAVERAMSGAAGSRATSADAPAKEGSASVSAAAQNCLVIAFAVAFARCR